MERLIRYYDTVVAGCAFLLVLVLNVAFPFGVQWLVHALASELRQSSRDPLTGLLIRRAFYHSTYGLLLRRREGPSYLGAAMIDLDNFKRLNDTHGHLTGDKALVAVAGALRLSVRRRRWSLASAVRNSSSPTSIAPRICTTSPNSCGSHRRHRYPVTASIGIVSAPLGPSFDPAERELIDDLVNAADTAMYAAKRAGGTRAAPPTSRTPPSEGVPLEAVADVTDARKVRLDRRGRNNN